MVADESYRILQNHGEAEVVSRAGGDLQWAEGDILLLLLLLFLLLRLPSS